MRLRVNQRSRLIQNGPCAARMIRSVGGNLEIELHDHQIEQLLCRRLFGQDEANLRLIFALFAVGRVMHLEKNVRACGNHAAGCPVFARKSSKINGITATTEATPPLAIFFPYKNASPPCVAVSTFSFARL